MKRALIVLAALVALLAPGGQVTGTAEARSWSEGVCPDASGVTVVVDFRSLGGSTIVRCAHGPQQTGLHALENAGISVTGTNRWGKAFVCRLEGKPAVDREPCVDTPPASAYWSYWHATDGGSWVYADRGVRNRTPAEGTFEGWSFYAGDSDGDTPAGYLEPRFDPVRPAPPAGGSDGGSNGGGSNGGGSGGGSNGGGSNGSGSNGGGSNGSGGSSDGGGGTGGNGSGGSEGRDAGGSGGAEDGDARRRSVGGSSADGDVAEGPASSATPEEDAEAADDPEDVADTPDEDADDDEPADDDGAPQQPAAPDDPDTDDGDGSSATALVTSDEVAVPAGGRDATGTVLGVALVGGLGSAAGLLAWRRRRLSDVG
ncbi:hypothetical protein FTX61_08830 [Nitriliruptoraceae bacterium ZYF776]|nr:hypothetical protein [Profundirhabdus halotolerans]